MLIEISILFFALPIFILLLVKSNSLSKTSREYKYPSRKVSIDHRIFESIKHHKNDRILLAGDFCYDLSPYDKIILTTTTGKITEKDTRTIGSITHYDNLESYIEYKGYGAVYPYNFKTLDECKEFYAKVLYEDELGINKDSQVLEIVFE